MSIINLTESTVVVNTSINNNVVVEIPQIHTVTTGIVGPPGPQGAQGIQGIQGPPSIYVVTSNLTTKDLLSFDGTKWVNTSQTTITEGGNF